MLPSAPGRQQAHPRTTGRSRREGREKGRRQPGDAPPPIVLVPANQAAARAAARPRPHQRAATELVATLNAAARRPRGRSLRGIVPARAQRTSTWRHGGTRHAQRTPSTEQQRRAAARDARGFTSADLTVEAQHRPMLNRPGPLYREA